MNKVLLKDVAIEYKQTIKEKSEDISIVGLEHLEPENILLENWDVGKENTFTKGFKKGHILFGRRRAYLKKAALAQCEGVCSGDITVIEAKEDKIDPKLLPFIIQNQRLFDYAVKNSAGSLSPRVKWEHLQNYEFMLPEMDRQKEISDILWSMENTKRSYEKMKNSLDDLIKSQFIEMLSSLEYEEKIIKEIVEYLPKSTLGASIGKEKGLYPFFTSSVEQSKWCDEYLYNDKAIILGNGGTASVNYYDGKFSTTNHSFVIKSCNENTIDTKYIYYYLLFNIDILEKGFHGVGLKNISKDYINEIDIPCINITEQNRIIDIIELLDKSKFEIEQALENLKKAQKSLLDEIFSSDNL